MYFVINGENPLISTTIRQIAYLVLTFAFIFFPLGFVKPKFYYGFLILMLPFLYIDFYSIFFTKNHSTSSYYSAVLHTNLTESKELIFSNILFFLITILSFILYLFLWKKLDFNYKINKKIKLIVTIICLGVMGSVFTKLFINASESNSSYQAFKIANDIFNYEYIKNSYPLGSIRKISKVIEGKSKLKSFITQNKDFSYNSKIISDDSQTIVMVLGETARKHNFQLYGYKRETNPELSKLERLIVFKETITNTNYTHTSFSIILSSVDPKNFNNHLSELGIVFAFKEAGFKTYWISNQNYNPGSIYNLYSKQVDELTDVSLTQRSNLYDENIFPFFKEILNDKNKKRFIVIHTMGSHYMYNSRYPKTFSKYLPELKGVITMSKNAILKNGRESYVNSYDNTILYTDYILASVIKELKKTSENSIMLYISDHGENLYDDDKGKVLHGGINPTKYELEIPMLLWYSDGYNKKVVERLKSNSDKKLSSSVVFHTLSSIGGFKTKLHQNKFDLLSDSLQVGNRLFYIDEKNVINIDN